MDVPLYSTSANFSFSYDTLPYRYRARLDRSVAQSESQIAYFIAYRSHTAKTATLQLMAVILEQQFIGNREK